MIDAADNRWPHRLLGLAFLGCMTLVAGCSSGRYYSQPERMTEFVVVSSEGAGQVDTLVATCASTSAGNPLAEQSNTLFVHPGMMFLSARWDGGLAVDGGEFLARDGYAARVLELNGRDPERMLDVMISDPGSRFIGLHYSMGGSADLVARSVQTTRQASLATGRGMAYYPLLVDPVAFGGVGGKLDMDSPFLGQMFVLLSTEYSALRTDIRSVDRQVLDHPKMHLLYAEDFGLSWGHFDALASLVIESPDSQQMRSREMFKLIANGIIVGAGPRQIEGQLNALKIRYALADSRPIPVAWLPQEARLCQTGNVGQG